MSSLFSHHLAVNETLSKLSCRMCVLVLSICCLYHAKFAHCTEQSKVCNLVHFVYIVLTPIQCLQALLLYDIRQLGLTEQLLHLSLALHNSTTPRYAMQLVHGTVQVSKCTSLCAICHSAMDCSNTRSELHLPRSSVRCVEEAVMKWQPLA